MTTPLVSISGVSGRFNCNISPLSCNSPGYGFKVILRPPGPHVEPGWGKTGDQNDSYLAALNADRITGLPGWLRKLAIQHPTKLSGYTGPVGDENLRPDQIEQHAKEFTPSLRSSGVDSLTQVRTHGSGVADNVGFQHVCHTVLRKRPNQAVCIPSCW